MSLARNCKIGLTHAMITKDALTASPPALPQTSSLSSHEVRSLTSRLTHAAEPVAEWRAEFSEWIAAIQELRQFEDAALFSLDKPAELQLRQHRHLLHLLMARGEALVLDLQRLPKLDEAERGKLTEQVDSFLAAQTASTKIPRGNRGFSARERIGNAARHFLHTVRDDYKN